MTVKNEIKKRRDYSEMEPLNILHLFDPHYLQFIQNFTASVCHRVDYKGVWGERLKDLLFFPLRFSSLLSVSATQDINSLLLLIK